MPDYYRAAQMHVSHRVVEVWDPVYRVYAVADLRAAWIVKRRRSDRRAAVRRACAKGAIGTVVLALVHSLVPGQVEELAAGIMVIFAAGSGSGRGGRGRCFYELWVLCNAVPVRLFTSDNPVSFNQVCHAVQRAVEFRRGET